MSSTLPQYYGEGFTGQEVVISQPTLPLFWAQLAALPGDGWTLVGYLTQNSRGNYTQLAKRFVQFPATYWQTLPLPYQSNPYPRNESGVGQTIVPGQDTGLLGTSWIGNR